MHCPAMFACCKLLLAMATTAVTNLPQAHAWNMKVQIKYVVAHLVRSTLPHTISCQMSAGLKDASLR